MSKSTGKNVVAAVVVGAAAGYIAGILTAPKSGKETREDIKNAADKYKTEAERRLQLLRDELSVLVDDASAKARYYSDRGKKEVAVLVDKAKIAQVKAREVISAAKSGEADDKDLDKAIVEASQAKKHLVDYMKKS